MSYETLTILILSCSIVIGVSSIEYPAAVNGLFSNPGFLVNITFQTYQRDTRCDVYGVS